jgi:hypothetical protein
LQLDRLVGNGDRVACKAAASSPQYLIQLRKAGTRYAIGTRRAGRKRRARGAWR